MKLPLQVFRFFIGQVKAVTPATQHGGRVGLEEIHFCTLLGTRYLQRSLTVTADCVTPGFRHLLPRFDHLFTQSQLPLLVQGRQNIFQSRKRRYIKRYEKSIRYSLVTFDSPSVPRVFSETSTSPNFSQRLTQ